MLNLKDGRTQGLIIIDPYSTIKDHPYNYGMTIETIKSNEEFQDGKNSVKTTSCLRPDLSSYNSKKETTERYSSI